MDRLQAMVAIGGDIQNTVFKDNLTWPEVLLMRHVHGNAAVTEIMVVGKSDHDVLREPERLAIKFGRRYTEVFHRYETNLPYDAPVWVPRFDDEVVEIKRVRRDGKVMTDAPSMAAQRDYRPPVDPQEYAAQMKAKRIAKAAEERGKKPRSPAQIAHSERLAQQARERRAAADEARA